MASESFAQRDAVTRPISVENDACSNQTGTLQMSNVASGLRMHAGEVEVEIELDSDSAIRLSTWQSGLQPCRRRR